MWSVGITLLSALIAIVVVIAVTVLEYVGKKDALKKGKRQRPALSGPS